MFQLFANVQAWLAALDPAAPAAALVLFVFSTIYAIRRWLPSVWKVVEATVPFAGSLNAGPVFDAVWKTWQFLPGALLGAATAALASGLSVKSALWGVGSGALASLSHELMSAYKGQVGGPPKPPTASYKPERRQAFPGSDPPRSPPPMAAMRGLAIGFLACLLLSGCAGLKPIVKDIDTAAVILCDVFFSEQPQAKGLSPADVEQAFCSTAAQVAPFLDSAKKAVGRGGAIRLGVEGAPAQ